MDSPLTMFSFHRSELWRAIATASGREYGGGQADFRRLREIAFVGETNELISAA